MTDMVSGSERSLWVDAGLADFIAFDASGTVVAAETHHLNNIAPGDDIFQKLPALHGFEDIFMSAPEEAVTLEGVALPGEAGIRAFDFRIARSDRPGIALVMASPNHSVIGKAAEQTRERRAAAYLATQLERERIRFRQVYTHTPAICFAMDPDGKAIAMSAAFERWIGASASAHWIAEFWLWLKDHHPDPTEHQAGERSFIAALPVRGTAIHLLEISVLTVQVDGEKPETYITIHDITGSHSTSQMLRRQGAALIAAHDSLAQSNGRLEQFAHIAAHDLLGPLGRIASFSEVLSIELGETATGMTRTAVDAIQRSASESITLVKELLELAMINGSRIEYVDVKLEEFISKIVTFSFEIDSVHFNLGGKKEIHADPRLLRLIVRNIISNSIKYRSHDRALKVEVRIDASDNCATTGCLTFSDNGIGFDEGEADPFAAFQRMRDHAGIDGAGLGLSMVKDAAERMAWRAGISSVRGSGTSVVFHGVRINC
jgi:signal transduction histidine kinase